MKIKTKKTMNLPQLIEWGFNNPELAKSKLYLTKEHDEYSPYVQFSVDGYGVRTSQSINNEDTFTVEVEEEITENTVLPTLIERRDFGNESAYSRYEYVRIKDIKDRSSTDFYIENDDYTMTLIWLDGKLIKE